MKARRRVLTLTGIFLIVLAFALKLFLNSIYRLPILMYHSISYTQDKNNRMVVSPEIFERQMRFLHDNKYNVITLEEAVRYIKESRRPPAKTVAITLDDGYENNHKNVYPVLKKYRFPATIFVVIDLVGQEGFMDWKEIKELSDSGIIDIESHTMSHRWLTGLDDAALEKEVAESKRILEERLSQKIRFLCFPMGGYNERVKRAVKEAGYIAAFGTKPTRLSPNYDIYEIKRVRISPTSNNLFVFIIKTSGYHAFLRVIQNDYKEIPYLIWKRRSS